MRGKISEGFWYIALAFIFWVAVECITVWHSKMEEWLSLMPYILIQYLVIVVIFYYFIFRKKYSQKKVFIFMLVIMYILEALWKNPFLFNVFWFIPGSLLLISIWGFLVFIPLWIVRKTLNKYKAQTFFYSLWIVVALGTLFLRGCKLLVSG